MTLPSRLANPTGPDGPRTPRPRYWAAADAPRTGRVSALSTLVAVVLTAGATAPVFSQTSTPEGDGPKYTYRFFTATNKAANVSALAFSPDGAEVAVATSAGTTSVIRLSDGKQVETLKGAASKVRLSADRRFVTMLGDQGTQVYDRVERTTATAAAATPVRGYVGVRFQQQDGKLVISEVIRGGPADKAGSVRVGDELTGLATFAGGRLESVFGSTPAAVSKLMAGSAGSFVELEMLPAGTTKAVRVTLQRLPRKPGSETEFADSVPPATAADSVLMGRKDHFDLVAPSTGGTVASVWPKAVSAGVLAAVSPDGKAVAMAGMTQRRPTLEVHDVAAGAAGKPIPIPVGRCDGVSFSPDGKAVYVLSENRVVKMAADSGRLVAAFNHEGAIDSGSFPDAFFVDGNQIVSEFDIRQFGGGYRWRVVGRNPDSKVTDLYSRIRRLTTLAVNPQGQIAVGTDRNDLHVLDANTLTHLFDVTAAGDAPVEAVDLSPDGKWLAYFAAGTLSVVDLADRVARAKKRGLLDDVAADPKAGTYRLTSAAGRFRATFPGEPAFDPIQRRYSAATRPGGVVFEVVWMDLGSDFAKRAKDPAKLREIYDVFGQSMAKHSNGKLGKVSDATTDLGPERRVEWTLIRDGATLTGRGRLLFQDGRLYAVVTIGPAPSEAETRVLEACVEQFQLTAGK